MFKSPQSLTLFVQAAAFVLVLALWLAAVLLWWLVRSRRERHIHQRLGIASAADGGPRRKVLRLWHEGGVAETTVSREATLSIMQRLERLRIDAGWTVPMPVLLAALGGAVVLLSLGLLVVTANPLLAAVVAILIVVIFKAWLQHAINSRTALFERQLVDAMDLGARSLRAGHPLSGSFRLIAEEVAEPVGVLFSEICEQEDLGRSVQAALEQCAAQSRSPDVKIFAASVVIQLRSGGNLADMMERVTWVIRERMRLNRRSRVLTAEAQLSKWILLALPLVMFMGLSVMNPGYMEPLFSSFAGKVLLTIGAASLLLGSWIMNRMAILKY
jgi:tight adherence protein B